MPKLTIRILQKRAKKSIFAIICGLASIAAAIISVNMYIDAKDERCLHANTLARQALDIIGNKEMTMWVPSQYHIRNEEHLRRLHFANEKIDQALHLCPTCGSYEIKGIILSQAGNLDDAILAFEKSIKLNPNYCWSYSDLAGVYAKLKKYDESDQYYKLAIQKGPKNPHMYRNYGLFLYRDLEKIEEAKQAFEKSKILMKDLGLELTFPRI